MLTTDNTFPICLSRAVIARDGIVSCCTHPRVHIERNRVSPEICRVCRYRGEPLPSQMRGFPFEAGKTLRRPEIEVVVAKFREDIKWVKNLGSLRCTVYDKSSNDSELSLPNIGREAHTYLHHIIDRYDSLEEVTVFTQGNPFDHVPDFYLKVGGLNSSCSFVDFCDHILVEDRHGIPVQPGIRLGEMFEQITGQDSPDFFMCQGAACFAVHRDLIRRRARAEYEDLMTYLLNSSKGPWEIERLWQFLFPRTSNSRAIVTAADAGFFENLKILLHSLAKYSTKTMVYDLGLLPEQSDWCRSFPGVAVDSLPTISHPLQGFRKHHWWQVWLKPFLMYHAPFDQVLWVDADCVVLDDPNELFAEIDHGPFVVRDGTTTPTRNHQSLYSHFPLPKGKKPNQSSLNSGVVGFSKARDFRWLHAWGYAVMWAAAHPEYRDLFAWADQGALLWAAQATNSTKWIRQNLAWNYPARFVPNLVGEALKSGNGMLAEMRSQFPDARILHFLGMFKAPQQIKSQFDKLLWQHHGPA